MRLIPKSKGLTAVVLALALAVSAYGCSHHHSSADNSEGALVHSAATGGTPNQT